MNFIITLSLKLCCISAQACLTFELNFLPGRNPVSTINYSFTSRDQFVLCTLDCSIRSLWEINLFSVSSSPNLGLLGFILSAVIGWLPCTAHNAQACNFSFYAIKSCMINTIVDNMPNDF